MPITHAKVSGLPDGSDSGQVQPSDWNAGHVGDLVQVATVHLSSAQIASLYDTPVEIVSAPGSGKRIWPLSPAQCYYEFVTTPYTDNGGNAFLATPGLAAIGFALLAPGNGAGWDQSSSQAVQMIPYTVTTAYAAALVENSALVVSNFTANPVVGAGDGTVDITVYYTVIDVA